MKIGAMFWIDQDGFPEKEIKILNFWKKERIFLKSIEQRKNAPLFSTYDGPPFATGLPHYGHMLASIIKDVIPRYQTMKGRYVPRRFGWDCHGLPVENEVEKAKGLAGAASIEMFGISQFNEECRSIVLRFSKEWETTVHRIGRWVDFDNIYRTMDKNFMESVWWVFSELWKKNLIYQGYKVMPFSAKLGTPLSNFEANLNYQEVNDPSVTVKFPLKDELNTFLLIWTTTPWTLTSNLATIVNAKLDYVKLKLGNDYYILGKNRVAQNFKEDFKVIETFKGSELVGKSYLPPFDYFVNKASPNAFTVLGDDFVSDGDGTGIVHAAPAFGEVDFFVCSREKIEVICPIDQNGKFTSEVPEYEGIFVKDANKDIIKKLKGDGLIFHHGQICHRYPFCWRSDTPLIYKVVKTWFVSVEKIKERLIKVNKEIHWVPEHLKAGRFGKWIENARDWAISRNRYWGTPIPLWKSEDGDIEAIGSVKELETLTGKKIKDLHRHFIDDLTFIKNSKTYSRIPEVFDCWFESGSMPYAQNHYPFEMGKETMAGLPADFIAEGLDQTRGWFYTLNILSVALFNKPAFKNVIVNGILLAEDGNKMSKKLKNYPEPSFVIDKYGADAIRLYLLHSSAVYAEDLRFVERGVELVLRQFLIPLWNSYVFLATYATIYDWKPDDCKTPKADIDRWILSKLQQLIADVEKGMDAYTLSNAVAPFVNFIESLTNWYIRRCRSRFWSDQATQGRQEAFETLYTVLITLTKIAAPFIPFLSDEIYLQLRREEDPGSVHLCDFPACNQEWRDVKLEGEMAAAQLAVSMGHALRKENKLKVRQPLQTAHLISADVRTLIELKSKKNLILDELNVKAVEFHSDESSFVKVSIKPNFRVLGKKVGPLMNRVKEEIEKLDPAAERVVIIDGKSIELVDEDIQLERKVREGLIATSEGLITVALDTQLSDELLLEGLARELVNKINTMRRNDKFDVSDRVSVRIQTTDRVKECYITHHDYICKEVLAKKFTFEPCNGTKWDLNGESTSISLAKI